MWLYVYGLGTECKNVGLSVYMHNLAVNCLRRGVADGNGVMGNDGRRVDHWGGHNDSTGCGGSGAHGQNARDSELKGGEKFGLHVSVENSIYNVF